MIVSEAMDGAVPGTMARSVAREAGIENLHSTVLGDEDVLGLQVAMVDVLVVRCAQTSDEFDAVLERALHDDRSVLEDLAKVAAFQQLH